jgi:hypothetical protein
MTSRREEGKEFVKCLKEWRSGIRSHVSLELVDPEEREDENESGTDNDSVSRRKHIIPEARMAIKR